MKEKIITIKVKDITSNQWSNLLLELNLVKKAWKPYGVNVEIKASGLKNVLKWGTTVHDDKKNGIRHNRSKRRAVSLSEIREERN